MRYLALATDFDGTLATEGRVAPETDEAIERLRASGRRSVMVTGRELADLKATYGQLALFDVVVAENGGVLHRPANGSSTVLAPAPPAAFVEALRVRGVPISVGAVIVATWAPHRVTICDVVRDLGLGLDVIVNKGAVMVLPAGVNKGTGVARAAAELSIPLAMMVGVGDAENDYTLLHACGLGIAVANALPSVKEKADLITRGARGQGVIEVIDRLVADDFAGVSPRPREMIGVVTREAQARDG